MSPAADPQKQQRSYERIYATTGLRDDQRFYAWVLRLLSPAPAARLLDVACGEGGVLVASRRSAVDACGIDISIGAAGTARTRSGSNNVAVGDAERLPFASEAFDIVTCLGSIENFEQPLAALQEIRRVLKPRGLFAAMMPNKYWMEDVLNVARGRDEQIPFQRVERVATLPQWRRVMESQGFSVGRVHGYVKRAPLFRGGKLRSVRKFLASHLLGALCPPALSWSVLLVCRKSSGAAPAAGPAPWLWRAEWVGARAE